MQNQTTANPIFIGGFFKSGTSLLRAMIGQHSQIASGLETYWFDVDWENNKAPNGQSLDEYIKLQANFFEIDETTVRSFAQQSADIYTFISRLLEAHSQKSNKSRWAEKTPGNVCHIDRILKYWQNPKIVHILRDPRDVFASLCQSNKWDTPESFADKWCPFFQTIERFKKDGLLTPEHYLMISYEHLITNPVESMQQVIRFLDEEWEDGVAQFKGKSDDYEKVLKHTGRVSSTLERLSKPLTQKRIDIWKDVISEETLNALYQEMDKQNCRLIFEQAIATTP